jgi:hypothetical protein
MLLRFSLTAAGAGALAFLWIATAAGQTGGTFRFGNAPFRYVDNAPGKAYTRDVPTFNTYFRTPMNTDGQIGPPPPPDQVSRLADELGHHLKMNYKHDVPEYNRRYVHFRAAMDDWNNSPQGFPQQAVMTQFLTTSIQNSMPGMDAPMPPLPRVNPIDQDSDSTRSPSVQDPFKDDPIQMAPM